MTAGVERILLAGAIVATGFAIAWQFRRSPEPEITEMPASPTAQPQTDNLIVSAADVTKSPIPAFMNDAATDDAGTNDPETLSEVAEIPAIARERAEVPALASEFQPLDDAASPPSDVGQTPKPDDSSTSDANVRESETPDMVQSEVLAEAERKLSDSDTVAADTGTAVAQTPASAVPMQVTTWKIVDGDTLQKLAEKHLGDPSRWKEIFEANRDRLQDPELLPIGIEVVIPEPETALGQEPPASSQPAASDNAPPLVPLP